MADASNDLDKGLENFSIWIPMEGESLPVSRHISELEIILYRSVPEEDKQPLFFDTTACLFSESGGQTDYVGVGRSTTNNRGLLHRPHAVLKMDTSSDLSENLLEPAGGSPVIPGDSVIVNLKKVAMWSGLSLCATLFSTDSTACKTTEAYYLIKRPEATRPLAVVPITCRASASKNSCIALMIRKLKANTKASWELVRVGETLEQQDVKGVLTALQKRGLQNPTNYRLLQFYLSDVDAESAGDTGFLLDDDDDLDYDDDDDDSNEAPKCEKVEDLLIRVPRVAREGRRQYSVGRSILNSAFEAADSSDEDEIMEDALREVVPRYTSLCPVRYEGKTYNVGSREEVLAEHYVNHREEYGLQNYASQSLNGNFGLPPIFTPASGKVHRFSLGTTEILRPGAPPELLVTLPSALCRRSGVGRRGRWSSLSSRRGSSARRKTKSRGRKKKGRRGRSRKRGRSRSKKSRSRKSRSSHKKKSKGRSRSRASRRQSLSVNSKERHSAVAAESLT